MEHFEGYLGSCEKKDQDEAVAELERAKRAAALMATVEKGVATLRALAQRSRARAEDPGQGFSAAAEAHREASEALASAMQAAQALHDLLPECALTWRIHADLLAKGGYLHEAHIVAKGMLERFPEDVSAREMAIFTAFQEGSYAESRRRCNALVDTLRAMVATGQHDPAEVEETVSNLARFGDHVDRIGAMWAEAAAHAGAGRWEKVAEALMAILEVNPEVPLSLAQAELIHIQAIDALLSSGEGGGDGDPEGGVAKALALCDLALSTAQHLPDVLLTRARCHEKIGRPDLELRDLRAAKASPWDPLGLKRAGLDAEIAQCEERVRVGRETHYSTLGLQPFATRAEVRSAYRSLSLLLHPDKGGTDLDRWHRVAEAYNYLNDDQHRLAYDAFIYFTAGHFDTDVVVAKDAVNTRFRNLVSDVATVASFAIVIPKLATAAQSLAKFVWATAAATLTKK